MPATPAEWTAERMNGTWIVRADHTVLAILEDRGPGVDQAANAALMAAAPELLDVAEAVLAGDYQLAATLARVAAAKATA